jgi:transketolase
MLRIGLIERAEFRRVRESPLQKYEKLSLLADMARANTLATVKRAGSGHLGSSFSCLDIITLLYYSEMNTVELGIDHPDRDVFFSSKGHDAPGQYSVMYGLGILPEKQFINLRRLGGTFGHPDVSLAGSEANTGSLGMGISKAKGIALGKALAGHGGRVFVMTGDGELQEGQIWESLQTAAHQGVANICAIVDRNQFQTDQFVEDIISLGDLAGKFASFGWHVERCDGHDYAQLDEALGRLREVVDKPKVLISDTVKGKGVSFMEGQSSVRDGRGHYKWHSGAPDDDSFEAGYAELIEGINARLSAAGLEAVSTVEIESRPKHRAKMKDTLEKVVTAYGSALAEIGARRKDVVVLDADLAEDCGLLEFKRAFPDRFVENGIAEQDMVSAAGGLALQGALPIVNSFGCFLASRANEQIYNNSTEKTKIIYVCHYAGLIPAGPAQSHQSLRDVSLFGALPDFVAIEPCNGVETKRALEWCADSATHGCMIRLAISPSPRTIELPDDYSFSPGQGSVIRDGDDAVLFAYGPVMLHEALVAAETLQERGIALRVVNLPWLNRIDGPWFEQAVGRCETLFALDNHSGVGGLGDRLLNAMNESEILRGRRLLKFAIDDHPACGTPPEVLRHHGVDGRSLADRIVKTLEAGA